jgi:hypothetical protein
MSYKQKKKTTNVFQSLVWNLGVSKFNSVQFSPKKTNQNQILKNLKIQTGTGSNRPVSVRFGFFNRITGKPVLFFLGFFGLSKAF